MSRKNNDGHYDLYHANDVIVTINNQRLQHIERIEIHESIESNFRYGMLQYTDYLGEIEFQEIYGGNTLCEIRIAGAFEGVPRIFFMKIIDVVRASSEGRGASRKMMTTFSLVEAPLYELLLNGQINKSWRNVNSSDIVKSIFPTSVLGNNFEDINADDSTFRFNRFICPFWTRSKLLQYIKYYSTDGPFLFYTTSNHEKRKTTLNYKSLQKLVSKNAIRDLTANINQGLNTYRNDYSIIFPTWLDMVSIMQGERVYNFQFTEGERKNIEFPQIGDYTFNSEGDQYFDAISSEYKESIGKTEKNSESSSFYPEFSNQFNRVSIDVDPKDSIKAKMLSRFFEKYHDQLEIRLTLPPFSETKIGDSFNISLPSFNEEDVENSRDEKLSGKFLLKSMSHVIYTTEDVIQKYIVQAKFVRTGYSTAVEDNKLKIS